MPFVLDASAALEAAFDDESGAVGSAVADRLASDSAYVPSIWFSELVHALLQAVRRDRLSLEAAHAMLAAIVDCSITAVPDLGKRGRSSLSRTGRACPPTTLRTSCSPWIWASSSQRAISSCVRPPSALASSVSSG